MSKRVWFPISDLNDLKFEEYAIEYFGYDPFVADTWQCSLPENGKRHIWAEVRGVIEEVDLHRRLAVVDPVKQRRESINPPDKHYAWRRQVPLTHSRPSVPLHLASGRDLISRWCEKSITEMHWIVTSRPTLIRLGQSFEGNEEDLISVKSSIVWDKRSDDPWVLHSVAIWVANQRLKY